MRLVNRLEEQFIKANVRRPAGDPNHDFRDVLGGERIVASSTLSARAASPLKRTVENSAKGVLTIFAEIYPGL